jgi:hypothetical protein
LKAYLTSFIVSISSLMLAIRLFVNAASVRNNTFLRPLQLQKDQTWSTTCFVADLGTVLQNYLADLNFGDALGTNFHRQVSQLALSFTFGMVERHEYDGK